MASIINASSTGSGGIVQTADASGVLQLQSNGTVALTISGANVSFGSSSSPSAWSQYQAIELINGGSNGALAKWGSGLNTAIVNNAYYSSAWTYYSTNTVALYQQETGATHNFYSAPSGTAGTGVSLTQLMTFAKDTSVALQGASRSSGTGISFPATQSASSDANTLDDYEEGTWTPTLVFSGGAGSLSYSKREGTYTKIGRVVYLTMDVSFSKGTASGSLDTVTGIPFSGNTIFGSGAQIDNMTGLVGAPVWIVSTNTIYIYMTTTGSLGAISATNMGASANGIRFSAFYNV